MATAPWRRVSSCDVLDPLGHILSAFFGRLVHNDRFASGRSDDRQKADAIDLSSPEGEKLPTTLCQRSRQLLWR